MRIALTRIDRRGLPLVDGQVALSGLCRRVEVLRDRWGVPHIYASDEHDLTAALGVCHAQDRLWQMELHRRMAHGTLSELFGEVSLETDRVARTVGFARLGAADLAAADDELLGMLEAYTRGINAWLVHPQARPPVEFRLLRHRPRPWTVHDTLAFSRVMVWELSHAWYGEMVRAMLIEAVGEERACELDICYPEGHPVTLPSGVAYRDPPPDAGMPGAHGPFLERGLGSNAWVTDGSLSDTGEPYLCNDMHLPVSVPCLWYLAHLHGGDIHVSGVTVPGMPGVLVGHNDRIAWGVTLAYTDCEDLFVEQVERSAAEGGWRYRFADGWREAEVIREPIAVKGRREPHVEEVVVTHHGPLLSAVLGSSDRRLALCSMSLRPAPVMKGFLDLDRAGSWEEFVAAMRLIEAPQLNIVYADIDGAIGYWVTGTVPVRAQGDGSVPAPGWTGTHEWVGEVPFEEMPHVHNPERGYLVTCNHRIVDDQYPHFLGEVWMNGYRARRIEERLEEHLRVDGRLTSADHQALHQDVRCLAGVDLVAWLASLERDTAGPWPAGEDARLAWELLQGWDGLLTTDSVGGMVYETVRTLLVRDLLEPPLGTALFEQVLGRGFHPLLMPASEFYGHDTVALLRMVQGPGSWWVEQSGGPVALAERALAAAMQLLRSELGPDPSTWHWGRLHRIRFPHAMGLQRPLDWVFDRGPFPVGGDTDTPFQTAVGPDDRFAAKGWAPTYRQVVDLSDLSRSVYIQPVGQSGRLGSPHYDDLIPLWLAGEYIPMLWTRSQVEEGAAARLLLDPV